MVAKLEEQVADEANDEAEPEENGGGEEDEEEDESEDVRSLPFCRIEHRDQFTITQDVEIIMEEPQSRSLDFRYAACLR